MRRFQGIWVALVTPFQQHSIDFPALQALAKHVVEAGVAGLVVCGSTGEAAALDEEEQLAVLDAVIDVVPNCPVVMGLSGYHVPDVLQRLQRIQERPIDGVLVPPPSYIRPSQAGLIDFFSRIAAAATVPVILYNIPYRTGVEMTLETIRTLAQHDNVVAIKDCGGNPLLTMQLIHDGLLDVLAGEDHQIFSTLCLGGSGAISASAQVRPDLFVQLTHLLQQGRLSEARALFKHLLPMIQLLFTEPNPAGVKALLANRGWIENALRSPMQAASSALQERLQAAAAQLGTVLPDTMLPDSALPAPALQPENKSANRRAAAFGSPAM